MAYSFGQYSLDSEKFELRHGEQVVEVEPQVFGVLSCLIQNRGRVVSKDELIGAVWDGRVISDSTLSTRINAARSAVGDSGKLQSVIRTIPRHGFRFVADVAEDLGPAVQLALTERPAGKPSIAVLPFENLSGDPRQEYISDGITEDIITTLSHVRQFMVIGRGSSFTYKGATLDLRQIARDLGVRYVLKGSVRKSGRRIRISVLLIDAVTGEYVWADRSDRDLRDLFTLQDEIAQSIAGNMEPTLARAEAERARRKSVADLDAWDLFQRGLYHYYRHTKEDFLAAKDWLEKAIDAAPDECAAYAVLSQLHFMDSVWRSFNTPEKAVELALFYGRKAVVLDREDAIAYMAFGRAMMGRGMLTGQFEDALSALRYALRINPNSAMTHYIIGRCLGWTGDFVASKEHLQQAMKLSPRDPALGLMFAGMGEMYFGQRDYVSSISWLEDSARVLPNLNWVARSVLVAALAHLGRLPEARSECENLLRIAPAFERNWVRDNLRIVQQESVLAGLSKAGVF